MAKYCAKMNVINESILLPQGARGTPQKEAAVWRHVLWHCGKTHIWHINRARTMGLTMSARNGVLGVQ